MLVRKYNFSVHTLYYRHFITIFHCIQLFQQLRFDNWILGKVKPTLTFQSWLTSNTHIHHLLPPLPICPNICSSCQLDTHHHCSCHSNLVMPSPSNSTTTHGNHANLTTYHCFHHLPLPIYHYQPSTCTTTTCHYHAPVSPSNTSTQCLTLLSLHLPPTTTNRFYHNYQPPPPASATIWCYCHHHYSLPSPPATSTTCLLPCTIYLCPTRCHNPILPALSSASTPLLQPAATIYQVQHIGKLTQDF